MTFSNGLLFGAGLFIGVYMAVILVVCCIDLYEEIEFRIRKKR